MTARPAISFVKSSERELQKFLSSYRRVSILQSDRVCKQSIKPSQVTFWIFEDGGWSYGHPNSGSDGGRSWCHSYLAAHFKWSNAEYQVMKNRLFLSFINIINGVYKHQHTEEYAVVYKPHVPLSGRQRAAGIVGGAIVGVGVARLREKWKNDRQQKKARVDADRLAVLLPKLETQKTAIKAMMSAKRHGVLDLKDLKDFESYKEGAAFAAQLGRSEFQNHVNFIDLLLKLEISEDDFEKLFKGMNFVEITNNELFHRIASAIGQKAFEAREDDTYCTFQIAREFVGLTTQGLQSSAKNPHFEGIVNLLDTCPLKTLNALRQIYEKPGKPLFTYPLPYAVQQYIFKQCATRRSTLGLINTKLDGHLEALDSPSDDEQSIEEDIKRIDNFILLLKDIRGKRSIDNVYYEGDYLWKCGDLAKEVEKVKLKLRRVKLLRIHQMSTKQMQVEIGQMLEKRDLTQPIDEKFVDYANTFTREFEKSQQIKNLEYLLEDKKMYDEAKVCIQQGTQLKSSVTEEVCAQLETDILSGAQTIGGGKTSDDVLGMLKCYKRVIQSPLQGAGNPFTAILRDMQMHHTNRMQRMLPQIENNP